MTNKQINIAIAEHCGWEPRKNTEGNVIAWQSLGAYRAFSPDDLPNYCNDLNAMHEAEKILTTKQKQRYAKALSDDLSDSAPTESCHTVWSDTIHATARQRAEAFLKTIGIKWKEGGE